MLFLQCPTNNIMIFGYFHWLGNMIIVNLDKDSQLLHQGAIEDDGISTLKSKNRLLKYEAKVKKLEITYRYCFRCYCW